MSDWQTVSGQGGLFVKWADVGQVLEGVLTGIRQGEFGSLYDFQQKDGSLLTIGTSYVLGQSLPGLVGKLVRITYNGKKPTKSGKTVKDFTIQMSRADPDTYATVTVASGQDDDDDSLPF
jgi:hypothetical protein